MNIICSKDILNENINVVSKAVSTRSSLNVLEGIYIKAQLDGTVILRSNDLEIGIESIMQAEVKGAGEVVINAKMFSNIIKALNDDKVSIEVNENNVTLIKSGKAKFEILGIPADEFPELPTVNSEYSISISKNKLKEMINKTIFSVSMSENRPVLTGCLFEINDNKLKVVAVDGYRMAIRETELENSFKSRSIIIPEKPLNELTKILKDEDEKVEINCTSKHAIFIFENYKMITRLIEGEYINYRSIISSDFEIEIECPIYEIIDSVSRASLIITNDTNKSPIKLKLEKDNINVSCETNSGSVDDNITIENNDFSLVIGFNNKYLLDAFRACDGETVKIKFNKNINPMVITPTDGDEFLYLILPVKLKEDY